MEEHEKNIIKSEENKDNQKKGTAMDSKMMFMMAVMMFGCVGASFIPAIIPAGWLGWWSGGIGFALLAVIMLACCIPMLKMMWTGKDQEDETVNNSDQKRIKALAESSES